MGPDVLAPLGLFAMVVLIVFIAINGATQKRKAILNTVEEAIRAGQQVTPEMIKALGMPRKKNGNGDLKAGAILLAVAVAFVIFGQALVGAGAGDDDFGINVLFLGIAAFPGLIGVVLMGFGFMTKKSKDEDG
jgi:hypothetical protein